MRFNGEYTNSNILDCICLYYYASLNQRKTYCCNQPMQFATINELVLSLIWLCRSFYWWIEDAPIRLNEISP